MKKIWYLCNADKKDKRVARLFVYENNGQQKAQLDLMSFSGKPDFSKVDIFFYIPHKVLVEKLCFQPEDSFVKQAMNGRGMLSDDKAKSILDSLRELQIRIIWGGKLFDSYSCNEELPPGAEPEPQAAGANETKPEPKPAEKEDAEYWLDEDSEDDGGCEIKKDGIRKIVQLEVLEEEMTFRNFVHNSFLLHGYYNYGHLVMDEKDGSSRLGVPGNYYEREKAVAFMFGFPDFEPAKDEIVANGTFGYYFTAYC